MYIRTQRALAVGVSVIGMKKTTLDSLTIRYIQGLEHENEIQTLLIKEQQKMIELLEQENASLREYIVEAIKIK